MKSVTIWIIVIVLLVLGAGLLPVIDKLRAFGSLGFTKSVNVTSPGQDRGYFYRFKASLAYKGEPLDFNIVVGCNVRVTTYKDNDRTVEVGVAPMVYGLKMKDGRGVVIRPAGCVSGRDDRERQGACSAASAPRYL